MEAVGELSCIGNESANKQYSKTSNGAILTPDDERATQATMAGDVYGGLVEKRAARTVYCCVTASITCRPPT